MQVLLDLKQQYMSSIFFLVCHMTYCGLNISFDIYGLCILINITNTFLLALSKIQSVTGYRFFDLYK